MNLKKSYTAQELANLFLSSLPHSRVGVMKKAKKDNWIFELINGKGSTRTEYLFDSLPADVQAEIKAKHIRAMLPKVEKSGGA